MALFNIAPRPLVATATRTSPFWSHHAGIHGTRFPKGVRAFASASNPNVNAKSSTTDGDRGSLLKKSVAALAAASLFALGAPSFAAEAPTTSAEQPSQHTAKPSPAMGDISLNPSAGATPTGKAPALAALNELPPLPYAPNALEPYIDAKTMEIHHDRHHQAYVTNLGKALEKAPDLANKSLAELQSAVGTGAVPPEVAGVVRNNGGGHWNHSFFWTVMAPGGSASYEAAASPELKAAVESEFGSLKELQAKFNAAATGVFGSGWAWLGVDGSGKLVVTSTPNQDNPLMTSIVASPSTPILGLDVWEHAYYLKHQNKRPEYVTDWWNVVNWKAVSDYYKAAKA